VPPRLSRAAREYRVLMWAMVGLAAVALGAAIAGARGLLPRPVGVAGLALLLGCIVLAGYFGVRVRGQALADRERHARHAMMVMLAAQLNQQTDEKLRDIASKGGPAAEAAQLLLEGRAGRR
jgi:hypothetical protein